MISLVLVQDPTFGCVSCFWQDLQDLSNDQMVLCIPFQYIMDLIVSLGHEWLVSFSFPRYNGLLYRYNKI
jgi:hypothetical protein